MAVFGLVCAPTLSHALASGEGQGNWVEVCSVQGSRRVALDPSGEAVSPGATLLHHLSHCPLCGLSAGGLAPAPEPLAWVALTAGAHHLSEPRLDAAPQGLPGRDAQPRAPPLASA